MTSKQFQEAQAWLQDKDFVHVRLSRSPTSPEFVLRIVKYHDGKDAEWLRIILPEDTNPQTDGGES